MIGNFIQLCLTALFVAALFILYFLPAIVAKDRRHRNFPAILVLNIFLGWTFIGWVIALVWAYTNNVEPKQVNYRPKHRDPREPINRELQQFLDSPRERRP